MRDELIVITSELSKRCDSNLVKLAKHMGIQSTVIQSDSGGNIPDNLADINRQFIVGAMSGRTLGRMIQATDFHGLLDHPFFKGIRYLLLYDLLPDLLSELVLRHLSSGSLISVSRFGTNDHQFEMSSQYPEVVHELSGFSIGQIDCNTDFGFECNHGEKNYEEIISINGKPFFVRIRKNNLTSFLVATNEVIDTDEKLYNNFKISNNFSHLVPYSIFLKYAFGDYCWHNKKRYASLIIDDPLLKEKYGFLDFRKLSRLMKEKKFKTTIAFIPWNYKRTNKRSAQFFREHKHEYNICVHGCDHTGKEFGSTDVNELNRRVMSATERMNRHKRRTGISYDKVMIFPQGFFSTFALKALKANNYLAAVNSSIHPTDIEKITISDYLDLALTRYGNFPVFLRRYPSDIADIAIDVFLGKPALVVEHHAYFKNGDDKISKLIDQVNASCADIQWEPLGEIALHSYLTKKVDDDMTYCHIYTNKAIIENNDDYTRTFIITKREEDDTNISGILMNDRKIDYDLSDGILKLSCNLKPKEKITIQVIYQNLLETAIPKQPLWSGLKVFGRRALSEFRDEFVCRHDWLLTAGNRIKSFMMRKRMSGEKQRSN